ncbi:MAG: SH3 domain-containing protein, partial [Cyanobacteria bacterium]|nr:SH3 domain-containing protein [Cyanobacteriota bacterium]
FVSTCRGERLMSGELPSPIKDEPFTTMLRWKKGKYDATYTLGDSRIAALYSVATCLVAPADVTRFKPFLAESVQGLLTGLEGNPAPGAPEFKVTAVEGSAPRKGKVVSTEYFRLDSGGRSFQVGLAGPNRKVQNWTVTTLEEKGASPAVARVDKKSSASNETSVDSQMSTSVPVERQVEVVSSAEATLDSIAEPKRTESRKSRTESTRKLAEASKQEDRRADRKAVAESKSERKVADRKSEDRKSSDRDKKLADRKSQDNDKNDKKVADRKTQDANDKKLATKSTESDKKVANQKKGTDSVEKKIAELKPAIADDKAYATTKFERHAPEAKTDVKGGTAYISNHLTSAVTVRSGPGTKFSTVSTTTKGAPVQVLGKNGGWYKVSVGGKQGYVYGGLVDYKKNDALLTAVVKKEKQVKHTDNGKAISTTTPGDKLVVVGGLEDNKYKVRLANGKLGYVDKDTIDVAIDEPAFVP